MSSSRAGLGWLRSPLWDAALLAFGWVPFYLWVALNPLEGSNGAVTSAFRWALLVALALNFLHRHYVLLLVYGDRTVFAERPRAYMFAPFVALAVVATLVLSGLPAGKEVVLGVLGTWNVWHVVQQRYGLLRAYAARARGGLETRDMSRADFRLIWAGALVTAPLVVLAQREALESRPEAALLLSVMGPWIAPRSLFAFAAAFGALFVVALVVWARREAGARPSARLPRYVFVASTFALFAIFVIHGPVVGYLVFGVAHSVEYLAFVHHFGERKYKGSASSVAARLLGDVRRAPILLVPIFLAYLLLHAHRFAPAFITYFSATSALHYLYDGWIWRLRQPKVAEPLVAPAGV
jgi:hypothetical protein